MLPKAREAELVIQNSGDDLLIYDLRDNKAICLNKTSALVWKHCDGTKSPWEIGKILGNTLRAEVSEDLVWFALEELHEENLLDHEDDFVGRYNGLTRRDVIRRIGLGSIVALPIISSLVAPIAIHAQSNVCVPVPNGCQCSNPTSGSRPAGTACSPAFGFTCANPNCRCIRTGPNGTTNGDCLP